MHYPELATVQARLTYRLTSFLLENLATGHTVEWMDAFRAQRHTASVLKITERELPWLATRVDPSGHKSFGRRMSARSSAATADGRSATRPGTRVPRTGSTCGSVRRTTSSAAPAPPAISTRRCCWPRWVKHCRCSLGATAWRSTLPWTACAPWVRGVTPRPPTTLEPRDAPRRTRSYRALLTGLAKAFRSSHESARAVSCS